MMTMGNEEKKINLQKIEEHTNLGWVQIQVNMKKSPKLSLMRNIMETMVIFNNNQLEGQKMIGNKTLEMV